MRTQVDMSNPINKKVVRKTKPMKCSPGGNKQFEVCWKCGKPAPFIINKKALCFEHSGICSGIRRAAKSN